MQDGLSAIAAKASTLRERLGPDFEQIPAEGISERIDALMQAWRAAAARGDQDAFQRRLSWDGLDEQTARRAVSPGRRRSESPLPSWATTLGEVCQLATSMAMVDRCLDPKDLVPFEDLLIPFVLWARSACERRAGLSYQSFSANAHGMLERNLLQLLSGIAARTLLVELTVHLADQLGPLDLLCKSQPSREGYTEFVTGILSGGFMKLFEEYAALGRMLASSAELWVEATAELVQRFSQDRSAICQTFGISGDPFVAAVESCASDPHNGLRAVCILRLGSGERIIYKPRPIAAEALWNELLKFCQALGAPVDFRNYRTLDKGEYGWTEYVRGFVCRNQEEVNRYMTRAGALLAIVYLLGGSDCHADNIILAGEYPVLIDVETMLAPKPRDCSARTDAPRVANRLLSQSVLNSYLLPRWSRGINDDQVVDSSAFGPNPGEAPGFSGPCWVDVNTDRMRIMRVSPAPRVASAGAALRESSRSLPQHEAELVNGFESMYRFLAIRRYDLLHPESPFQRLRGVAVRFVYRNTAIYAAILDRLTRPEFLRDGAERSVEIEELALAALTAQRVDGRSGWADIWRSERDAVERGDVPHFTGAPGALALCSGSKVVVPDWFPECSHDLAIQRLQSLNDVDLRFQVDVIRSTIRSRVKYPEAGIRDTAGLPTAPQDPQAWIAEAVAIARTLAEQSIRGADGSICWIQRGWSPELQVDPPVAELQVTGNDLYSGATGIALFLAAVERIAPGNGLLPYALGAIQPLIADLAAIGNEIANELGIGGLCGVGSVVYALTCMSELLAKPDLMQPAECAVNLITEKRINDDGALDVTLGSAGALLALLAYYEATGSPVALQRARQCGERLLAALEKAGDRVYGIRTLEGKFLAGFSHGAAGIAYSLCRLYALSGEARFLAASRQLIAFERAVYSPADENWPDLRHLGSRRFMPSWCHGAPGIGLARMASLYIIDEEETVREVERAIVITQQNATDSGDCVCCGTFGRIETLWTAGRLLKRRDLCQIAQSLAWHRVLEARGTGGYAPGVASVGQFRCLGLFQGLAGIGYTFLRLAAPDLLPHILLLGLGNSALSIRRHRAAPYKARANSA